MQCTENGILLAPIELAALLGYAGLERKNNEPNPVASVQFAVKGDRVFAYSTNDHAAVKADGESDGRHRDGEWLVTRGILDKAVSICEADQAIRIPFAGKSLTQVQIEDKLGKEVSDIGWPHDAVSHQTDMFGPMWGRIEIPQHKTRARCVALNTKLLLGLNKVARAAGRAGMDTYFPARPDQPVVFTAASETTRWTVMLAPMALGATEADPDTDATDQAALKQPALFGGAPAEGKVDKAGKPTKGGKGRKKGTGEDDT